MVVKGHSNFVLSGDKGSPPVFHNGAGLVAVDIHNGVALLGQWFLEGQQHTIIPLGQTDCRVPREAQGSLLLQIRLLLFDLQQGKIAVRAVAPESDLPPNRHPVHFLLKVAVLQRVKIERTDGVSVSPVVGVLQHKFC